MAFGKIVNYAKTIRLAEVICIEDTHEEILLAEFVSAIFEIDRQKVYDDIRKVREAVNSEKSPLSVEINL